MDDDRCGRLVSKPNTRDVTSLISNFSLNWNGRWKANTLMSCMSLDWNQPKSFILTQWSVWSRRPISSVAQWHRKCIVSQGAYFEIKWRCDVISIWRAAHRCTWHRSIACKLLISSYFWMQFCIPFIVISKYIPIKFQTNPMICVNIFTFVHELLDNPSYIKNSSKIFFSGTGGPISTKLCM